MADDGHATDEAYVPAPRAGCATNQPRLILREPLASALGDILHRAAEGYNPEQRSRWFDLAEWLAPELRESLMQHLLPTPDQPGAPTFDHRAHGSQCRVRITQDAEQRAAARYRTTAAPHHRRRPAMANRACGGPRGVDPRPGLRRAVGSERRHSLERGICYELRRGAGAETLNPGD